MRQPSLKIHHRERVKRKTPELHLHEAVVQHLEISGSPEVLWFHCPNGEYRDIATAVRLKRMGVKKGVPDLLFFTPHGENLALELKAKGGRLSEDQHRFQERWALNGGFFRAADNIDDALRILREWNIIRPQAKRRAA